MLCATINALNNDKCTIGKDDKSFDNYNSRSLQDTSLRDGEAMDIV
jgi:hypothetical protein